MCIRDSPRLLPVLFGLGLQQVHDDHQDKNHDEHQRKQRVDLRLNGLFRLVVDLDRECNEAGAGDELSLIHI